MKLFPADLERRRLVRSAAVRCTEFGEGAFLVGFDWQPHFWSSSGFYREGAFSLEELSHDLQCCWRAVVHVSQIHSTKFSAVVLDVGGDGIYGVSVNVVDGIHRGNWITPDPLRVLELSSFRHS